MRDFLFFNISPKVTLIEISHIGYKTISEYIDIVAETKKDYVLTESGPENSAVIVTGTNGATPLKKVPFQVTVLRKEELLQSSSTNIIEKLIKKTGYFNHFIRTCHFKTGDKGFKFQQGINHK